MGARQEPGYESTSDYPHTHTSGESPKEEASLFDACNTCDLVVKAISQLCTSSPRFESYLFFYLSSSPGETRLWTEKTLYHLYLSPQSMAGIGLSPVVLANKERNGASNLSEEEREEESHSKHNSTFLGRRENSGSELRKQEVESAPDSEARNTSKDVSFGDG